MNDSQNQIILIGAQIAEFDAVEAGLGALEQKYAGVAFAVSTTKGMAEAIAARAACRAPRVKVEKVRKDAKAPILALGRSIDSRAAEITARLVAIEDPIDDQIKAEESRKAAEREEKARIERERLAAIAAAELAERERVAAEARRVEEERLAAERAELARQREEQERAAAAERERAAAERRAIEAELAEARRIAAEALAAERAEAERLAKIERDRLAAERAEFERQRAEARAAAEAEARRAAEEADRIERERVAAQRAAEAEAARLMKIESDRIAAERAAAEAALEKVRAAAPMMLEALRLCLSVLHNIDMVPEAWRGASCAEDGAEDQRAAIDAARAAIAAATEGGAA